MKRTAFFSPLLQSFRNHSRQNLANIARSANTNWFGTQPTSLQLHAASSLFSRVPVPCQMIHNWSSDWLQGLLGVLQEPGLLKNKFWTHKHISSSASEKGICPIKEQITAKPGCSVSPFPVPTLDHLHGLSAFCLDKRRGRWSSHPRQLRRWQNKLTFSHMLLARGTL